MNFRAAADIAELTFDDDVGVDRFDGFDGLLCLPDVFLEGERGSVEADHIVPGSCGFLSLGQRMRMVAVQEDREIIFIADAFDDGSGLPSADKSPLSLRGSDEHRHSHTASGCRDGI